MQVTVIVMIMYINYIGYVFTFALGKIFVFTSAQDSCQYEKIAAKINIK